MADVEARVLENPGLDCAWSGVEGVLKILFKDALRRREAREPQGNLDFRLSYPQG